MLRSLKKSLCVSLLACGAMLPTSQTMAGDENTLIMVSGPLVDPFFSTLKQGFEDGAAAMGMEGQYSTITAFDNVVGDLAKLVEVAAARQPAGLLVGNFFPDALNPIIKQATDDGTPVVIHNSGLDSWESLGALGYVGEEPVAMGEAAGKKFIASGVKNVVCFMHVPGNPALELRCDGLAKVMAANGGTSKNITLSMTDNQNQNAALQSLRGAIMTTPDLGGIFTLGSTQAAAAVQAVADEGKAGDIMVGTTDISSQALQDVKDGKLGFVLDQQPYLQGFYSATAAALYHKYGMAPSGVVKTGPMLIDASTVDRVIEVNTNNPGIRGAQ